MLAGGAGEARCKIQFTWRVTKEFVKDKACYGHYRLETAEVKPGLLNSHGPILGGFYSRLLRFPCLSALKKSHFPFLL